jgi:hypothetical protein
VTRTARPTTSSAVRGVADHSPLERKERRIFSEIHGLDAKIYHFAQLQTSEVLWFYTWELRFRAPDVARSLLLGREHDAMI